MRYRLFVAARCLCFLSKSDTPLCAWAAAIGETATRT